MQGVVEVEPIHGNSALLSIRPLASRFENRQKMDHAYVPQHSLTGHGESTERQSDDEAHEGPLPRDLFTGITLRRFKNRTGPLGYGP